MYISVLKSKIHRATVTDADLNYVGSITIDEKLMESAQITEYEKVQVVDVNNGSRLETYAIKGEAGSGVICLNGAAARCVQKGDIVIIMSYAMIEAGEKFSPKVVMVDKNNKITSLTDKIKAFEKYE